MDILCLILNLYLIALGWIILSLVPDGAGTPMASVYSFLFRITEPLLGPLRRAIPAIGGGGFRIDLSPIIVLIGIRVIQSAVLGC